MALSDPDGQFVSFQEWVNKASSWLGGQKSVCMDGLGRICRNGSDFQRARDEGEFPVRYFLGITEEDIPE